ncbi:hypothetical protein Ancab_006509 [Ancistrocladus abbreviatus]
MVRLLSRSFRYMKPHNNPNPNSKLPKLSVLESYSSNPASSSSSSPSIKASESKSSKRSWCVYLILSTNPPIKTYVGVTTNFSRRLKQHNGELKGGAKASRAGRPWVCACIIQGFSHRSEACEFESKWKSFSRKLPRKKNNNGMAEQEGDNSLLLLQHRQAALQRVKHSCLCDHLAIDWQLNPC